MEKPLSLVIDEFRDKINTVVMEAQLPPVIIEMIFKDIYNNIRDVTLQYSQNELNQYLKDMKQAEEEPASSDIKEEDK